ncbi:MAG TPA: hypothetical protein VE377_06695 [Candidatus Dormibacteraeota bacterium]|nr:hypothetical protein [Candidatus Dormibacteraeota bacterium]
MERLYRTVVQLEEAKRQIEQGDVAHLRLGMILLDNAVEVMMHRVIEDEFRHADMWARMLKNFPTDNLDAKGQELRREMESHVIPPKRQKEIRRVFGEKIKFLSEDHDKIPLPCARVLRHLHDYRNETQHNDEVREESIMAASLLYFDIAVDFLVRVNPGSTIWIGGENYDWLKRYGTQEKHARPDETRPRIAEALRAGLPLDIDGIRTALAAHLKDRIEVMENQLVFVEECLPEKLRAETPLKVVQFWHQNPMPPNASIEQVHAFVAPHGPDAFAKWHTATHALNQLGDKLEMFDRFATIEDEFEPLEKMIDDTVADIDREIQHEIDVARGK